MALKDLLRKSRSEIDISLNEEEIAEAVFEENAARNEIRDINLDNEDDYEGETGDSETNIAIISEITDEISNS
jgi:hypothetical protein